MKKNKNATTIRINAEILYLVEKLVIKKVKERHKVITRADIVNEAIKMYAEKEKIQPKNN